MIQFLSFVLTSLISTTSFSSTICGDNKCEIKDLVQYCQADCKNKHEVEGIEIKLKKITSGARGIVAGDQILITGMSFENGLSKIVLERYDTKTLQHISTTSLYERKTTRQGDVGNPVLLHLKDKRLLLAFRDHNNPDLDMPYNLRSITSINGGHQWTEQIANKFGLIAQSAYGLWEPFLYFNRHGDISVVYAKERPPKDCPNHKGTPQDIALAISIDDGENWQQHKIVATKGVSRDGVPSVASSKDGKFILAFESWQKEECGKSKPQLTIRYMKSSDGLDWSSRTDLINPKEYKRNGEQATWPFALPISDNRFAIAYTTDKTNVVDKINRRYDAMIAIQRTEDSWQHFTIFDDSLQSTPYRFPSLIKLDGERVIYLNSRESKFKVIKVQAQ